MQIKERARLKKLVARIDKVAPADQTWRPKLTVTRKSVERVLGQQDGMKAANITGVLLGIVIGLAFLAYSYGMQNIRQGSLLGIVSLLNFICAAFFLLLLPFDFSPMPTTPSDFLVIAVSGLLLSGISYALYGAGIRKIKLETAMIVALAEPILNPLWVYLKMGIVPSLPTLIGLGFILMGTVVDVAVSFFKKTD